MAPNKAKPKRGNRKAARSNRRCISTKERLSVDENTSSTATVVSTQQPILGKLQDSLVNSFLNCVKWLENCFGETQSKQNPALNESTSESNIPDEKDKLARFLLGLGKEYNVITFGSRILRKNEGFRRFEVSNLLRCRKIDLANWYTPYEPLSKDVLIYHCSLSGDDHKYHILEANRLLKVGGFMLILEEKFPHERIKSFIKGTSQCGFKFVRKTNCDKNTYVLQFIKTQHKSKISRVPSFFLKSGALRKF
ncbi:ribosomal RNA-processing protein 8-like [Teleopsis dalmanni]|uniref:ribosomal RNA-processing protein 8-like n=1 Tax=Teleopsis dalmanni TaxID=139649 RepID=UPI0018CCD952|nr:ribosomal RNA-processing protein 8-like [Teleopsis dalmanni]XP_037958637.1 ribosomal RNA-processing protein 8-like [Teleopsis dalmanni]